MHGLRERRVLISGGSSGIGKAAAQRMLEEGARVHLGGLDAAEVESAVLELRTFGHVTGSAVDVSQVEGAERLVADMVRELGGLDVLANNAGTAWRESFLQITPEHWDRMLAVNLRGMFLVAQAAGRVLVQQGDGGAVVNMSSTNGLRGEADYTHYNASKAGVLLLTRTMAIELAPHQIRVNALCPGYIDTPLNATITSGLADEQFATDYVRKNVPLGRIGRPEDVAAAYAFLASDDAAFITGAEIVVDGGQMAVM